MAAPIATYRDLFPVTEQYTYLNHAACSAMPRPGTQALARYWEGQTTRGFLNEMDYFPVIDHAREKMARLIGADISEVGWTQNTATAIGLVANGLQWQDGDNVVTVLGEFPANVYPWLDQKRHGVETRLVPKRDGRAQSSVVTHAFDPATRTLRISVTEGRAKTRNLQRDPRVTLHVASRDFWTWVAVEGTAELTPVAADPNDATVDELVAYYRGISGEHENWDEYRAAMVADRRLVVRFRPEHTYGQLSE